MVKLSRLRPSARDSDPDPLHADDQAMSLATSLAQSSALIPSRLLSTESDPLLQVFLP